MKKNAINSSGTHLTVEGFVTLQNIKRIFMNQYEKKTNTRKTMKKISKKRKHKSPINFER